MAKKDFNDPKLFINRELSWLEFNQRVLLEGLNETLPLLERLKFLAIVSSNLDEFFMIRVAGLRQQREAGLRRRDLSGLTPNQQLSQISKRAHEMVLAQSRGIGEVVEKLAEKGLHIHETRNWRSEQTQFLRSLFSMEFLPVLTPMVVGELSPFPTLPGLQLNVAVLLEAKKNGKTIQEIAVVPVPRQLARFVTIPAQKGAHLARLGDIVAANIDLLFPGQNVIATSMFRITRDADVAIQEDEASDLLAVVEQAVLSRRRRDTVRLEMTAKTHVTIRQWLVEWLGVRAEEIYEVEGILDAAALMEIANRSGFDKLKVADWPIQPPRDLPGTQNLWKDLQDRDVLLFHPYESFEPVVQLVEQAAADPDVLAIKQILYRTSGDSPIVRALERAAENGKQVTVLLELKARFDEARNVNWARRLEDAGCLVIYGIAGFKTHAKALLVVRRETTGIKRYVHLATGNYNDQTARLYTDMGLMTTDRDLAGDVAAFFNLLTGYSEDIGWQELSIAPTAMRRKFIELIEREIQAATPDHPGLIMVKVNSLQDLQIIQALYRASKAGVKILLNVRGICCLRPGLKKISQNIEVVSIIDRYLEHPRIFYFQNGGHDEVYLSSADWMGRNLDKRLELLFPVKRAKLKKRIVGIMKTYFSDNVKAYRLLADGRYEKIANDKAAIRAQETFHHDAVEAAQAVNKAGVAFRPLSKPENR